MSSCTCCGAEPAEYLHTLPNRPDWREELCELCARLRHRDDQANADTASETLAFALSQVSSAGFTDIEILRLVEGWIGNDDRQPIYSPALPDGQPRWVSGPIDQARDYKRIEAGAVA